MPGRPLITCQDLSVGYPSHTVIDELNWQILPDQHWVISGPNGSGKTSLLKTLMGRLRPLEGKVLRQLDQPFERMRMVSFTDTSKLFSSVNHVHYYQQRYNSWDSSGHLTVAQYLEAGGYNERDSVHRKVINDLDLTSLLSKERIKLSSGQTRKMLVAKALIQNPSVLLLDNLYIGLDAESRLFINDMLDALVNARSMTLVISGHYTTLPKCVEYRLDLPDGNTSLRPSGAIPKSSLDLTEAEQIKVGDIQRSWKENRNNSSLATVFEFKGVSISYGDKLILNKIDWKVNQGERWNLKGNNGSGKSTLVSLMYGDNPQAYAKSVFVFGQKRGFGESIWDIKSRIGFTSPELHAYFSLNLTAGQVVATGLSDHFELLHEVPGEFEKFCLQLLAYFDLDQFINSPFGQLSTGQQRIILFIRSLIKKPPVLLLDEPFQGFDIHSVRKAKFLLDSILQTRDTMIFISHFEHEVPNSVDKVFYL